MTQVPPRNYVPAAGHDWLLPLYDPFLKALRLDALRELLLAPAVLHPNQRVLDVGCGTGTLVCELKRRVPALDVTGIDPDPRALSAARKKVDALGREVKLEQAFGDALPFSAHTFDHVFSSFMLHHLAPEEQRATLSEVLRVLKPAGTFHVLDFQERPHQPSLLMRVLHAFSAGHHIAGQRTTDLASLVAAAGFAQSELSERRVFLFGHVAACRARAPDPKERSLMQDVDGDAGRR